jgi:hypothetical protein
MTETATTAMTGLLDTMAQAYSNQAWAVLAGVVLMFVVMAARKFVLPALEPTHTRWVALGLAMATSVGVGLQSSQDWFTIAVTAISTGLVAIGSWETLGKALRRSK